MDRYRSPQSFTSAAISIGTPRPLRPHGPDEATTASNTPATRQHALSPHTPVIPFGTPMFEAKHNLPADEHGVLQVPEFSADREPLEEPTPTSAYQQESRRGFMGTLLDGLRRIPRAMEKHHSRQSLYEEYLAEAQTAALRQSQMSPAMNRRM